MSLSWSSYNAVVVIGTCAITMGHNHQTNNRGSKEQHKVPLNNINKTYNFKIIIDIYSTIAILTISNTGACPTFNWFIRPNITTLTN
jgi:hypothetical protein